jgi:hypothetical protein
MLNAILRRTLVWSLPLAAAYQYLLSVYGRPGKSSLAVAALLFPLFGVLFASVKIYKASRVRSGSQRDAREAEVIWDRVLLCHAVGDVSNNARWCVRRTHSGWRVGPAPV